MTHKEAMTIVTEYTNDNLLESLERIQDMLNDGVQINTEVKVAYYTLMAGFTELLG